MIAIIQSYCLICPPVFIKPYQCSLMSQAYFPGSIFVLICPYSTMTVREDIHCHPFDLMTLIRLMFRKGVLPNKD